MQEKKRRLTDAYEHLRSIGKVHTQNDVAFAMGANKTNVSYAFNGNEKYLTESFLKRFNKTFGDIFNIDWLLSGEGEMLNSDTPVIVSGSKDMNGYRMVPVYNFDVVGGMNAWADVVDSPTYIEKYVPFTGAAQGDICVQVTGNSMMPTYSAGSLLLIRKVEGWAEYFGYGHCYVLLLKDGRRILKEVQKSQVDPQKYVLCVSYNPQNPPEELPRDFIVGVYKVIMTLTNEGY